MKDKRYKGNKSSIRHRVYIFIIAILAIVAFGTLAITYRISTNQMDRFYKQSVLDNSRNFASLVDGDYLMKLKNTICTDEYIELREKAANEDNEELIENFLKDKGLWEEYKKIKDSLQKYIDNSDNIKYLYLIIAGDETATEDQYLIDDWNEPLYSTGLWEEREGELLNKDIRDGKTAAISNGDWGWLCSGYYSVYDSNGNYVCVVGCDTDMGAIMQSRREFIVISIASVFGLLVAALIITTIVVNKIIVRPLDALVEDLDKFDPMNSDSYDESHVISLNNKKIYGEMRKVYLSVQKMQTDIIDHMARVTKLERYKVKIEKDIESQEDKLKAKDEKLKEIRTVASRDALTGVGSKLAYNDKVAELRKKMGNGFRDFAFIMVDINNLKMVNDKFGHELGDKYIQGCCSVVCDILKHSPVFRIGGDEFVAVLQGDDFLSYDERCNELRSKFEETYSNEENTFWERYSAAVGVAVATDSDKQVEDIFKRADKNMYDNKMIFREKNGSYR